MIELLDKTQTEASMLLDSRPNSQRYDQGWVGYRIIFGDLVTERVQTKFNGLVYELDRNLPTNLDSKNRHYHTAPQAMKIVDGIYFMERGRGDLMSQPISQGVIPVGSSYEMLDSDEWHNIAPETYVYTFGIMGSLFDLIRVDLSKVSIEKLSPEEIESIKSLFKEK